MKARFDVISAVTVLCVCLVKFYEVWFGKLIYQCFGRTCWLLTFLKPGSYFCYHAV